MLSGADQQSKLQSSFHIHIRFSEGFSKDHTCDDKPLHCVLCAGVCLRVLLEMGETCVCVLGGSYPLPSEYVLLLSRPQTPLQSRETIKAEALRQQVLNRLSPLCVNFGAFTKLAPQHCPGLKVTSTWKIQNEVQMSWSVLNGNLL